MEITIDTERIVDTTINRIELISEHGRQVVLSRNTIKDVQLSLQDDGKTLKVFYTNNKL